MKPYESLRDALRGTLQRNKINYLSLARLKGPQATSFNDEMDKLERNVLERIGRLKVAIKEGEAVVATEAQQTGQIIESLKENVARLETRLKQSEENIRKKVSAGQKIEENLSARIQELQSEIKKKDEALEMRANEARELTAKIEAQARQAAQLESDIQKLNAEAVSQAKRVDDLVEILKTKAAALEARLRETEETVRAKEQLLAARDEEIEGLKAQIENLTRGVKDMVSFFKQAEALAGVDRDASGAPVPPAQLNAARRKPAAPRTNGSSSKSKLVAAVGPTLAPEFFDRLTKELTQVIGPMAPTIIREHVTALGETMETFPKDRATELVEIVGEEIGDAILKSRFLDRLSASGDSSDKR